MFDYQKILKVLSKTPKIFSEMNLGELGGVGKMNFSDEKT